MNRYNRIFFLLIGLLPCLTMRPTMAQNIRYVQSGATGNGLLTSTPSGSLPAMLSSLSATGGTVLVGSGLYTPTSTTARTASFSIASGVAVYGGYNPTFTSRTLPGQPGSTTLSGNISNTALTTDNSYHIVQFKNAGASTRLDGVLITAGNANGTVADGRGGGVYNDGGGTGNSSNPLITNCVFTSNSAGNGGGLYNWGQGGDSSPTLINCIFQANFVVVSGGSGGAISNDGRANGRSSPTLINCTLYGNVKGATGVGSGIYSDGRTNGVCSVTLTNCVVWNNGGNFAFGSNSGSVTTRYCLIESAEVDYTPAPGTPATLTTDPLFVNEAGGDFRLRPCSSPALNTGDPATTSATVGGVDLDGQTRFFNSGRIDMGAFEVQVDPIILAITTQPPASSTVCAGSSATVSVAFSGTTTGIQWFRGSTALTGQTSATLSLTNITAVDAGTYRAVLTGTCTSLTTSGFSLNLVGPLGFSSQPPASSLVCPGATVTAAVSVSGAGPFGFQWFNNGVPLTGIASATTRSLTLTGVSATQAGHYVLVVTGACTSVSSTAFALTIRPTLVYVTPSGAGLGNGSTVSNALAGTALVSALASACASSTFLLSNGLYRPTEGTNRTLSFVIPSGIQVYGGYDASFTNRTTNPSGTTVTGEINAPGLADNSFHVVRFRNASPVTRLDGVMITGGNATGNNPDFWGGGVYNNGQNGGNSAPTIINCTLAGNAASSSGGALYNDGFAGNSSPTITNCVFTSNTTGSNGGAIFNDGASSGISSPTITHCQFSNNTAVSFGGAIGNNSASPVVQSCTFTGNACPENGGAVYSANSRLELIASEFTSNRGRFGGAIYLTNCQAIVTACTVTSNAVGSSGGAIHTNAGSLTVAQSTFSANRSGANGGAITNDGGTQVFINDRFTGNVAGSGGAFYLVRNPILSVINGLFTGNSAVLGGVFYNAGGNPNLLNCTLFGNTATSDGTVIFNVPGSPTLTNCVVWNNGGQNAFFNYSGNTTVSHCLIEPAETSYTTLPNSPTTLVSDPRFLDAPTGDFRPSACSPLIDAGDPTTTTALVGNSDLNGQNRIFNTVRIDIGSFEFQGSPGPLVDFLTQPAAASTVCAGERVSVPVSVSGAVESYQWFRNGTSLTAQTGATLSLSSIQLSDAGAYSVVVTGCRNSVTSTAFSLTVNALAGITEQPVATSVVCVGTTVTAFISASGTISGYQWFKGTTALSGQSSATLTLTNVQPGDTGDYSVQLSTPCINTLSMPFSLTVQQPVGVASLANNGALTCAQTSVTLTATAANVTSFTLLNTGQTNAFGQFVVSSAGSYTVRASTGTPAGANNCTATSTASSSVGSNTDLPGATLMASSLTFCSGPGTPVGITLTAGTGNSYAFSGPGLNQNGSGNTAIVSQGGSFLVVVTGVNGCTASASITLTLVSGGVSLGVIPPDGGFCEGAFAQVAVPVTGSPNLFRWYRNGSIVSGQTSATLSLPMVQTNQAGRYLLVATANCNSATSTTYNMTVGTVMPTVTITLPNGSTVVVSGQTPAITLPQGGNVPVQVTGGVSYQWTTIIDRINGYEIRQVEQNITGLFTLNRPGPYRLTVTSAGGCSRTVEGIVKIVP